MPQYVGNFGVVPNGGWSRHHRYYVSSISFRGMNSIPFLLFRCSAFGKTADECVKQCFHNPNMLHFSLKSFFSFPKHSKRIPQTLYFVVCVFRHCYLFIGIVFYNAVNHTCLSLISSSFVWNTRKIFLVLLRFGAHAHLRKTPFLRKHYICFFVSRGVVWKISSECSEKVKIYEEKISLAYSFDIQEFPCSTIIFIRLFLRMVLRKKRIIVCGIVSFFLNRFLLLCFGISEVSSSFCRMSSAWIFEQRYFAK